MFEDGPSGEEGEEGETTDDGSDADGSDADINLDSDEEDAQSGHELDDVFDASSSEVGGVGEGLSWTGTGGICYVWGLLLVMCTSLGLVIQCWYLCVSRYTPRSPWCLQWQFPEGVTGVV